MTRLFAKSASFYNPLIYFGMSSKFRNDISVLLPCTRERREVVRLQHFKNFKPKAEDPPPAALLPVQNPEAKYATAIPESDSGVNSPPHTPPFVITNDLPSHIETSEYWCDRLWRHFTKCLGRLRVLLYICFLPVLTECTVICVNELFSESQVGFHTCWSKGFHFQLLQLLYFAKASR